MQPKPTTNEILIAIAEKFGGNNLGRGNSDKVMKFENVGNMKKRRRWDSDAMKFTISRTEVATELFRLLKQQRISLPAEKDSRRVRSPSVGN